MRRVILILEAKLTCVAYAATGSHGNALAQAATEAIPGFVVLLHLGSVLLCGCLWSRMPHVDV